jgi:hypothetical protein
MIIRCAKSERDWPYSRKSSSRCCTCGGRLEYPYAVWVPRGLSRRALFFCNECSEYSGGLVRDLNELAELKRAATQKRVELKRAVTQMHAMPLTETRH